MKLKTLLVLSAMLVSSISQAFAGVAPKSSPVNLEGGVQYLYNVEAQGFFVGANNWTTRASISRTKGWQTTFTKNADDDLYTLRDLCESKGNKWFNVMCETTSAIYTDAGSQPGQHTWNVVTVEGDYFMIANTLWEDTYLTWDVTDTGGDGNETICNMVVPSTLEEGSKANIWYAVSEHDYYVWLLETSLENAKENNPEVDFSEIEAVANNPEATNEELIAAEAKIAETIDAWKKNQVNWSAATAENPIDVSELILNRSFDNQTYENWSGTGFGKGGRTDASAELYAKKYDTWQKISNIPNGVYRVSVDGFYRNGNTANAMTTKGQKLPAYLYGTNGTDTLKTSLKGIFDGIEPDHSLDLGDNEVTGVFEGMTYYVPNYMTSACAYFNEGYYDNSVLFAVTDGYAIIGLRKDVLVSEDWTIVDNFGLEYLGDGEDAYKFWAESLAANSKSYDEVEYVTADVLDAYNAVLAAAGEASTYEAVVEATKAIEAEAEKVDANIAKWNEYLELLEQAKVVAKEFKGPEADILGDYPEFEAEDILNDRALSTEEIAEEIANLQGMIDAATENGITEGANVTSKIKNASFKGGFTDWTNSNGGAVVGTFGGLVDFPCVEVYNNVVDVTQTVTGLPKGVYELSCQAFERPAGNGSWTGSEPSKVSLYMNNVKTPVQNIAASALPEGQAENYVNCFIEGDIAEDYRDTGGTKNLDYLSDFGYVPNGMSGASYAFRAERYKQTAKGLVTDGVMKIGLTSNGQTAHWVLWSGFTLKFLGMDPEILKPMVEKEMEKINLDETFGSDVKAKADSLLAEAGEMTDGDKMLDMIDKLIAMNEKVEASKAIFAEVTATKTKAEETLAENETYLPEDLTDEVTGLLGAFDDDTATDEDAKKFIEDLNAAIANMEAAAVKGQLMSDYADELASATVDNPADLTDIIKNANFDEGADQVWVSTKNGGNGPVLGNGIYGTPSAEFWNGTASDLRFDINQTIAYLPEGTYVLSADAANSLNSLQSNGETGRAYLYVEKDGEGVDSVAVNVVEGSCVEEYSNYSVVFYVEEGAVKIGFKTVGTMEARWFVCDNFTLKYLGAENHVGELTSITDVNSVKSVAPAAIFTINGAKVSALKKGVNIVRMSNGQVRKVLVK